MLSMYDRTLGLLTIMRSKQAPEDRDHYLFTFGG